MNRARLKKEREKIDIIDQQIFRLIIKRTNVVKKMLALKKYKHQIVDHKRINIILKNIRKKSIQQNLDPKITHRIWKAMIWSYVDFQRKNFKKK